MPAQLPESARQALLQVARQALGRVTQGDAPETLDLGDYALVLRRPRASFVTLSAGGKLRGCVGTVEPIRPLVMDVQINAVGAGFHDARFDPLQAGELGDIVIEIACLSGFQALSYTDPPALAQALQPGRDGVLLKAGESRATFLPKVWEKLPEVEAFLSHLCVKLGADPDLWRRNILQVFTYQTEVFGD